MNVKHVSASPVGMEITCETELTEVDGRRLVFTVKAYDTKGLIGEGVHERFVIVNEKFQAKTDSKKKLNNSDSKKKKLKDLAIKKRLNITV